MDRVVGLEDVRCELSILQTADGHGRLELRRFKSPAAREGDTNAPPNTLGIRRIAFSVDDIDAAVARVRDQGLELLGEVVRYEGQLPALLHTRPGGDHRDARRADRLTIRSSADLRRAAVGRG